MEDDAGRRSRGFERRGLVGGGAVMAALGPAGAARAEAPAGAASLDDTLRPFLASHGLPALAAAVVRGGRVAACGAVGTRRAGADIPVTLRDRFHIGSDTKAITSLLAGAQVEAGALRWDSRVGEVFPELAEGMDAQLRGVTLVQLLSHTSGLPSDDDAFSVLLLNAYGQGGLNLDGLRLWMLREVRGRALAAAPGSRFAYSNLGYVLAGAMVERAAGRSWEELAVSTVFEPLGLDTAGFGPQSSVGRVDAPLGHLPGDGGSPRPMLAGPNGDNPPVLGPAGTVHMSILDFARWAGWHAGGGRREPALVRPDTVRVLHTPVVSLPARPEGAPGTPRAAGGYALGWGIVEMPWAPGAALTHTGSNTMNLALIVVRPERDVGVVAATNIGGERADAALRAVAALLDGPGAG